MQTKTTAKDFFLHLGSMVALYAGVVALLNLLFQVINTAFPAIDRYFLGAGSIGFPVATLIVVFPLYLLLVKTIRKGYEADPSRKDLAVRRWLVWITLFVAGVVLAGDLVTLLYFFLDGRELTAGFLLKVLAVLVVAGGVFGYYIDDLRDRLSGPRRTTWRIFGAVLVVASIVLGFAIIGSPQNQRFLRYDEQKVGDLQNIQSQVITYWQQKETLPGALSELKDPLSSYNYLPNDPQTGEDYSYRKVSGTSFELCANFNRESRGGVERPRVSNAYYYVGIENENWVHPEGRYCFERTVDPDRYPPFSKSVR